MAPIWNNARVPSDDRIEQLMQFLTADRRHPAMYGPEAMRVARQEFGRTRLPLEAEDVVNEAVSKIVGWCHRNPDRPIDNVGALFRTTCRSVCTDVLRGAQRRVPETDDGLPDDDGGSRHLLASDDPSMERVTDVGHGSSTDDLLVRLRVLVERLGASAVAISGALTFLALSVDPHIDVSDAPAPKAGVASDRASGWPALWFATRESGLFVNRTAVNRRRQRRISEIFSLLDLVRAHLNVGLPTETSPEMGG